MKKKSESSKQQQLQQNEKQVQSAAGGQQSQNNAATGALAEILDLDFGSVQNSDVDQRNRQYILEQAQTDSPDLITATSYATREPLRPSFEVRQSEIRSHQPQHQQQPPPSHHLSSNSSTASSSGEVNSKSTRSRKSVATANNQGTPSVANNSNSGAVNNESVDLNNTNTVTVTSAPVLPPDSLLRDTKIEIAGKKSFNYLSSI